MVKKRIEFINSVFIAKDEKTYQHLNSKGYGQKVGDLFEFETFEVLYLLEKGKIEVYTKQNIVLDFNTIVKKKKVLINSYLVYKNLKKKDYNVRSGLKYGVAFRIYRKGVNVGDEHSQWLVEIYEEKDKLSFKDFLAKTRIANTTKKKVLIAIIDTERNITYIESIWKRV